MSTALITAIGTFAGAVISGIVSLLISGQQHSKTIALVEYRIGQLEEKVDKHNNLVERMYAVESKLELIGRNSK